MPAHFVAVAIIGNCDKESRDGTREEHTAEQVVNLLRQIEAGEREDEAAVW
jgi:hypothetical protein